MSSDSQFHSQASVVIKVDKTCCVSNVEAASLRHPPSGGRILLASQHHGRVHIVDGVNSARLIGGDPSALNSTSN